MIESLRDVAVLVGLLGPAGLIGYVWRASAWKSKVESKIASLEASGSKITEWLQNIEAKIDKSEQSASDYKIENTKQHYELQHDMRKHFDEALAGVIRDRKTTDNELFDKFDKLAEELHRLQGSIK